MDLMENARIILADGHGMVLMQQMSVADRRLKQLEETTPGSLFGHFEEPPTFPVAMRLHGAMLKEQKRARNKARRAYKQHAYHVLSKKRGGPKERARAAKNAGKQFPEFRRTQAKAVGAGRWTLEAAYG